MKEHLEVLQGFIEAGQIDSIKTYLNEKNIPLDQEILNLKNEIQETLLIYAISLQKIDIVKFFLEEFSGALDLFVQSYHYGTPLVAAVFFESEEIVQLLIKKEKEQEGSFSPKKHPGLLLTAIRKDNPSLVTYLLDEGVDINDSGEENYEEPPYWFESDQETPFDIYGPNVFELPIITAIQDNCKQALPVLIKHKPDMNKIGSAGYSAQHLFDEESVSSDLAELFKSSKKTSNYNLSFFNKAQPSASITPSIVSYPRGNLGCNSVHGESTGKRSPLPISAPC